MSDDCIMSIRLEKRTIRMSFSDVHRAHKLADDWRERYGQVKAEEMVKSNSARGDSDYWMVVLQFLHSRPVPVPARELYVPELPLYQTDLRNFNEKEGKA
jgi:hypothetical protein